MRKGRKIKERPRVGRDRGGSKDNERIGMHGE